VDSIIHGYDWLGRTIESGKAMLAWTEELTDRVDVNSFPTMGLRPIVERTRTFYSAMFDSVEYLQQPGQYQRYLRNRVGFAMRDRYDKTTDNDSVVTACSYDPHGNVEWMMTRQWGLGNNYV